MKYYGLLVCHLRSWLDLAVMVAQQCLDLTVVSLLD